MAAMSEERERERGSLVIGAERVCALGVTAERPERRGLRQ